MSIRGSNFFDISGTNRRAFLLGGRLGVSIKLSDIGLPYELILPPSQGVAGQSPVLNSDLELEWRSLSGGGGGGVSEIQKITSPLYAATASLSALRMVALNTVNQLTYASSDNPEHAHTTAGLITSAVNFGNSITVISEGFVTDSAWNWTPKQPIYLGLNGLLTQSAPTSGFIKQVAIAFTPTSVYVDLHPAIFL